MPRRLHTPRHADLPLGDARETDCHRHHTRAKITRLANNNEMIFLADTTEQYYHGIGKTGVDAHGGNGE